MRINTFTGALAAPFLMTLLSSIPAFAEVDWKSYPGSMCVAQGVQGNQNLSYNTSGQAFNVSTTALLSVLCPIIQDNNDIKRAVPNPNGIRQASVVVLNRHPSQVVRCRLDSRRLINSLVDSQQMDIITGTIPRVDSAGPANLNPYYYMLCTIPPAVFDSAGVKKFSGISSYSVGEDIAIKVGEDSFIDSEK
jgi:hypothetical protein